MVVKGVGVAKNTPPVVGKKKNKIENFSEEKPSKCVAQFF